MNKDTMELYAKLEEEKRKIEERQAEIKEEALTFLKEAGSDKIESDFGSFTIVARKTWKYSEKIAELDKTLKTQKKTEETDGTATAEVKESITFYPVKTNPTTH